MKNFSRVALAVISCCAFLLFSFANVNIALGATYTCNGNIDRNGNVNPCGRYVCDHAPVNLLAIVLSCPHECTFVSNDSCSGGTSGGGGPPPSCGGLSGVCCGNNCDAGMSCQGGACVSNSGGGSCSGVGEACGGPSDCCSGSFCAFNGLCWGVFPNPAGITLSPSDLNFTAQAGDPPSTNNQTLTLAYYMNDTGAPDLTWWVDADASWCHVDALNSTDPLADLQSTTMNVYVDPMPVGNYYCDVTVSGGGVNSKTSTVTYTVSANLPPSLNIDTPANNATVSGTVAVQGWALDNSTQSESAMSSVQVTVDGNPVGGNIVNTASRPDVCALYSAPDCPNVGWTTNWDTASLANGSHSLMVTVQDSDGSATSTRTITVNVNNTTPHIVLSPTTFTFNGVSGTSTPAGQTMTISDSAAGSTLKWSAATNQSWCHVSPASGTAPNGSPSTVTVSMDAPSTIGSFLCTITVSDNGSTPGANNSPQTATATYNVVSCTTLITTPPSGGSCSNLVGTGYTANWSSPGPQSAVGGYVFRAALSAFSSEADGGCPGYPGGNCVSHDTLGAVSVNSIAVPDGGKTVSPNSDYYNRVAAVCATPNSDPSVLSYISYVWTCNSSSAVTIPNPPGGGAGGGGGSCNNSACSPTPSGGGSNPSCGVIRLFWTDNSNNETGFKIYVDGVYAVTAPASSPASATGGLLSYDYSTADNNPHSYTVSALNGNGESAQVSVTNVGGIASGACSQANLSDSDKDIVSINGNTLSGPNAPVACNASTNALPSSAGLKLGDRLKFQINLCNDHGSGPASQITLSDTMVNLIAGYKSGDSGYDATNPFNAFYGATKQTYDGACSGSSPPATANHYCTYGSIPNQSLAFNLNTAADNISASGVQSLALEAKISVPSGFSGSSGRLQNSFNAAYDKGTGVVNGYVSSYTPLLLFSTGKGNPTIIEVP